ncbi:MAG: hypothetical protein NE327_10675 [Lentisphaeraceae bacterium]|nr:hypothetical protein [Lentisphaeraceae bacterium]
MLSDSSFWIGFLIGFAFAVWLFAMLVLFITREKPPAKNNRLPLDNFNRWGDDEHDDYNPEIFDDKDLYGDE